MPKLGETMEEGYLVSWKKNEGEKVEKGDVLFEVMSDKTNFEVEALDSGYLRKKLYEPSDAPIPVTTVIGYISDSPDEPIDVGKKVESKSVVEKSPEQVPVSGVIKEKEEQEMSERIKASPVARKLAEDAGIDISLITGTGPDGRIEKKDVLEYLSKKGPVPSGEYVVKEWTPLRRIIARRLSESKREIPHFYLEGKFLVDEIVKIKDAKKGEGVDLTYTDFLIFFGARAIKEYPLIDASLTKDEVRVYSSVDIGLAVSIEDGLLVPVLRNCESKSIYQISKERRQIIERARLNKLTEEELSNARFIISNLGMFGVENFQPIISPPGVAIMGVGKIGKEVVAVDNSPVILPVMNVSFSFDHRVIDGTYAGMFYKRFKELIEHPVLD
ncbi:MAG: dihydrolipoamide acetyltransferase family protein [Candidatus Ratteibacteria bacterium]|nr:dihydrolipoamide acetyltransferase family protein [Candidatus Ratteibacteria bacterium]